MAASPSDTVAILSPQPVTEDVLTPQGLGPIVIGQAPPSELKADAEPLSESCRTYTQEKYPRLYVMTDGKVVTRITVMSGSPIKTSEGVGPGASEAVVRKAYPDVVEQSHKYVAAPAEYLDWRPGGGTVGLRFEIDADGRVTAVHAGREPYIELVEGCA